MTQKNKIIISAVAIVVLLVAYISIDMKRKKAPVNTDNTQSTTTENNIGTLNPNDGFSYTIEEVPVTNSNAGSQKNILVPDLSRPVTFRQGLVFTEEAKTMITNKIVGLQADLRKDKTDLEKWLDLAMYQKTSGDYEGAKISWQYVANVATKDFVALGNLGNLYAYYIRDNAMAEDYYKQALLRDPKQSYLYIQLAEVYRDVFKDMDKARAIIDQGLSKVPNDPGLMDFKSKL